MTLTKIPINTPQDINADSSALGLANETMVNGIYDQLEIENEFVARYRPGLTEFVDLGTGAKIDGKFNWKSKGWCIMVSGGSVFKVTKAGVKTDLTGAGTMNAGTRPTFALIKQLSTGTEFLFMASGGQIAYTNGTATTAYVADATAPTNCTHIAAKDQAIIANDTQNDNIYNSTPGDPFTWSALSFVSAEASVDTVNAVKVVGRDILLFGQISIEPFWSTGGTPLFERRPDALIERGTDAPYSIASKDNTTYFLDDNRKVVAMRGTQLIEISKQINNSIRGLSTITNALGDISEAEGSPFYILKFPTDNRTFAYSINDGYWTEYKSWDSTQSDYKEYIGDNHLNMSGWGFYLVGDHTTDKVYKASLSTYQDNGTLIRFLKRTGHWNGGSKITRKFSKRTMFDVKRGVGSLGTTPRMAVRQNINKMGFGTEQYVEMLDAGQTGPLPVTFRGGIFNTKQFEFVYSENTAFFLIGGEEEFEELDW